uniref:Uncharacterized protein n=1 Tax=Mycena chlorophos TaxID=658473 RepID=A0ABQ0M631_MYCCL|nr:predicted protein [Mycena chlorophos]
MRAWITIKSEILREIEAQARSYATQNNLPPERILDSAHIYATELFNIAQSNIRLNGRDYDSLQPHEQDAEPFDEALDRQIWALSGTRQEWFDKIASDRRDKPSEIAANLAAHFKEADAIEHEWATQMPSYIDEDEDMDPSPILQIDDAVTREILAVSNELTQTIPAQQERAERAKRVEAEIKSLRP